MVKGVCPNCQKELDGNTFVTRESEIFKGHNVYIMCKDCGLIMMYNEAREALFSLDRFKEDEDVINEIKTYLSELVESKEEELEKIEEEPKPEPERRVLLRAKEKEDVQEEQHCNGNCENCQIECAAKEIEEFYEKEEDAEEKEPVNLEGVLYMVHKKTDERRFISANDLHLIKDLDEWAFYEFQPVLVEPVISYKIHRL